MEALGVTIIPIETQLYKIFKLDIDFEFNITSPRSYLLILQFFIFI